MKLLFFIMFISLNSFAEKASLDCLNTCTTQDLEMYITSDGRCICIPTIDIVNEYKDSNNTFEQDTTYDKVEIED